MGEEVKKCRYYTTVYVALKSKEKCRDFDSQFLQDRQISPSVITKNFINGDIFMHLAF